MSTSGKELRTTITTLVSLATKPLTQDTIVDMVTKLRLDVGVDGAQTALNTLIKEKKITLNTNGLICVNDIPKKDNRDTILVIISLADHHLPARTLSEMFCACRMYTINDVIYILHKLETDKKVKIMDAYIIPETV